MDALLLALLGCLLGEIGDKSQLLILALATRYDRNGAVIAGIIVAATANALISAFAGAWIILGIATRTGDPALAAIGGAIGVIAALVPIVLLRDRLLASIPVRLIRGAGAAILLLTGGIMAITALGLL